MPRQKPARKKHELAHISSSICQRGATNPLDDALPPSVRAALALAGAWSDLQHDDKFMARVRIRHESTPTPSLEEQLA